jgi:hypothetical protein
MGVDRPAPSALRRVGANLGGWLQLVVRGRRFKEGQLLPPWRRLVAGAIIGWFARRKNNLTLGIVVGLIVGGLIALPIALSRDPVTGQQYFWEILIPGALVGLIVGYATQRYGARPAPTQRARI